MNCEYCHKDVKEVWIKNEKWACAECKKKINKISRLKNENKSLNTSIY